MNHPDCNLTDLELVFFSAKCPVSKYTYTATVVLKMKEMTTIRNSGNGSWRSKGNCV